MGQTEDEVVDAHSIDASNSSDTSEDDDAATSGYEPLDTEENPNDPQHSHEGNGKANGIDAQVPQSGLDNRTAAHLARLAQEARGVTCADTPAEPGSTASPVDVATLAATARALSNGCQPVDFAGWGTPTISDGAAVREDRNSSASSLGHCQQQHSRAQSLPKVVVTSSTGTSSGDTSMDITEEKRTAILGAMKNFSIDYMPKWAAVVPEETWVGVLKDSHGTANGDASENGQS